MSLVKKESTSLATPEDVAKLLYSHEEMPSEVRTTPRVSLLQSNSSLVSEFGYRLGTYHCTEYDENYGEVIEVIPVKAYFGAVYLSKDDFKLICKSLDGIHSTKGDMCRQCPYNEYHLNWKIKGIQPKCQSMIEYVLLEAKTKMPIIVCFKSKSYKAGRDLFNKCKQKVNKGDMNVYTYKIGVSKETKNGKGYFISKLVGEPVPISDPSVLQSLIECKNQLAFYENAMKTDEDSDGNITEID